MILPETFCDVIVEAITYLFFYFFYFLPNLKGVLVLKGTSDITACQCLALLSTGPHPGLARALPRPYSGLIRASPGPHEGLTRAS